MSDANGAIESFRIDGLEKLLKAIHRKPPVCHVGVIGDSTRKSEGSKSAPTNATVGAAHEFGTSKLPKRSFLRMPVSQGLQAEMDRSGLFDEHTMKEVIKLGTVTPWLEKVAICAEACIQEAFDTGGNGNWPAWKNPNYTNNAGQLLVDTHQLRDSILSDVDGRVERRAK